jgi:hypothetical protein
VKTWTKGTYISCYMQKLGSLAVEEWWTGCLSWKVNCRSTF